MFPVSFARYGSSFNAQGDQFPSLHVHLCTESFKRLLAEIATPYFERRAIGPCEAGRAILSRGPEKANNPCAAVCASLAFLEKHIFLINPELQRHWGALPLGRRNKRLRHAYRKTAGSCRVVTAGRAERIPKLDESILVRAVICSPMIVHDPGIKLLCGLDMLTPDLRMGLRAQHGGRDRADFNQ